MQQLHRPAAELDAHPIGVDDVGAPDIGLKLLRRNASVAIAVFKDANPRLLIAPGRRTGRIVAHFGDPDSARFIESDGDRVDHFRLCRDKLDLQLGRKLEQLLRLRRR